MTDFKIGPPAGPPKPKVDGVDGAEGLGKTPEAVSDGASPEGVASAGTEAEVLVEQLRSGQIDLDQAVEMLVERTLESQPLVAVPERLRGEIRSALNELIRDDPTLAELASAMKR